MCAEGARRAGFSVVAVAHHGETPKEIQDVVDDLTWVYVGQLGRIIRTFKRAGITEAVMAGGIKKVKLLSQFRPDLRGARFLARMRRREDDALLRGVADELESEGIKILASTFCLPQMIPSAGVLTQRAPDRRQWEDIRMGFRVAKEIGRLGIGQTVIVKNKVVVAVEAVEGTDAAVQRGGGLAKSGYVVVKVSNPEQDLRFDVPAIGVDTIKGISLTRGAALAVEAGKTLLLEKDLLIEAADSLGIAVVAVSD